MIDDNVNRLQNDPSYHPNLHLLALERTGWRRWLFGRWVYSSEPFRLDIQIRCAKTQLQAPHEKWERLYDARNW